jgi:hypothetical protein
MRLAVSGAFRVYFLLTISCGGAAFVCAAGWWSQTSVLQELDTKIAACEERIRDLEAIRGQIAASLAKRRQLEDELNLIERRLKGEKAAAAKPAGTRPTGGAASKMP